uniref:Uncharacterized protein n=1 Tax=Biomphalaria glabrata TaxID=6526 RepID=A0A2C9KL33_BIOGL
MSRVDTYHPAPADVSELSDQSAFRFIRNGDYERLFFGKLDTSNPDIPEHRRTVKEARASIRASIIKPQMGITSRAQRASLTTKQCRDILEVKNCVSVESAVNPASQNHDLLSKLYSKLQDFDDLKDEEFGQGSQTCETKIPK